MNLVPFPKLHYLVTSQTPLITSADVRIPPRRLDQMFTDAFSPDHQLIKADPKHSLYLACALMVRGNVEISDIRRNIERWVYKCVDNNKQLNLWLLGYAQICGLELFPLFSCVDNLKLFTLKQYKYIKDLWAVISDKINDYCLGLRSSTHVNIWSTISLMISA